MPEGEEGVGRGGEGHACLLQVGVAPPVGGGGGGGEQLVALVREAEGPELRRVGAPEVRVLVHGVAGDGDGGALGQV